MRASAGCLNLMQAVLFVILGIHERDLSTVFRLPSIAQTRASVNFKWLPELPPEIFIDSIHQRNRPVEDILGLERNAANEPITAENARVWLESRSVSKPDRQESNCPPVK